MKKSSFLILFLFTIPIFISNCNISTANISDIKVCDNIHELQCPSDNPVFSCSTPVIYVSCILKNAPAGTPVKFALYYVPQGDEAIAEITIESKPGSTNEIYSEFSAPDIGWHAGAYKVVLSVDTDNSEPISKTFKVE